MMDKWHVTQTLLGCEPGHDINQRKLYRGEELIRTFNENMDVWEVWKDEALRRVCDELNKVDPT